MCDAYFYINLNSYYDKPIKLDNDLKDIVYDYNVFLYKNTTYQKLYNITNYYELRGYNINNDSISYMFLSGGYANFSITKNISMNSIDMFYDFVIDNNLISYVYNLYHKNPKFYDSDNLITELEYNNNKIQDIIKKLSKESFEIFHNDSNFLFIELHKDYK